MAEVALFSLASKLLGQISCPAFKTAYQRVQSIWVANEDLDKLKQTIQTIQAVLLDAEKKQDESALVKDWIERVRDVLYEADDLFDDVATDSFLKQQHIKGNKLSKVRVALSKFNPVISSDNIAKKVNAIRKRLDDISKDMPQFSFIQSRSENRMCGLQERVETRPFVDEKIVIGRDDEKKEILEFLLDKSDGEPSVSVIAIVGIGGMGKTTLAQLVYNHEEVQRNFDNKWWACISDRVGEANVLESIARSINGQFCHGDGSDPKQLISRSVITSGSYLLVLDDVWDTDLGIWFDIMSLLSRGAKGSKIVVTTRFESVPRAVHKDDCRVYTLKGLSDSESWELFKRIAFTKEHEKDPKWASLGREIVKKCANVPLAIRSMASLLLEKNTIQEWESFKDEELSKIMLGGDSVMSTLRLSYDHLPSDLKHCFAYCSLFRKDYRFIKEDLVCQWIAQGYVKPNDSKTFEEAGHACFMELLRKSFFQEVYKDKYGEIHSCKMHDLIHDLAKSVAGMETVTLHKGWNHLHQNTRHLRICCHEDTSQSIPQSLLDANRLRSCFSEGRLSHSPIALDIMLTKFNLLRSLDLSNQGIENVPSSVGDLKHLRYLKLSENKFTSLPGSLTKLVNLITLSITFCNKLEELPIDFKKLINLRHLYTDGCYSLRHMPPDFGELTCLQRLSCFKVGKKTSCSSRLDVLAGLSLKGLLDISFDGEIEDWDEDECWQLPTTVRELSIMTYPGIRIPHWGNFPRNLVSLEIYRSSTIKHLPPFRSLPYLNTLALHGLDELEYVEEDSENSPPPFFPCLEVLLLWGLKKLRGWSRDDEGHYSSFPLLSRLAIVNCQGLQSMPLSPFVRSVEVRYLLKEELMQQLISTPSSLEYLRIMGCDWMKVFRGESLASLRRLEVERCCNLKKLDLAPRNVNMLEELKIEECRELELWEEEEEDEKRGVDWDSLTRLRLLEIRGMGQLPERLPLSLQQLHALRRLHVE